MSTISIPSGLIVSNFSLQPYTVQRNYASPFGGSEQVVDLLNDRWMISLEIAPMVDSQGGIMEGFLASLRGMANVVNLWHMARPKPQGTISGSPTVNGAHSVGAATLNITTSAGATLKMGDLIGANGLLLMAASDATADGSGHMAVSLTNRLRKAMAGGEAVTLTQPTAPFRCTTPNPAPAYSGGLAGAVQLDFVEYVS
jgi:hypothetical protein